MIFDPIQYKINSKNNWNIVAPRYHKDWADSQTGPFRSTSLLVDAADIQKGHYVLDLACGTGVVSREVFKRVSESGLVVGIDLSRVALNFAKSLLFSNNNKLFIEMDIENMGFSICFDRVVCQYGLMFLSDPLRSLKMIKSIMKQEARLAAIVHGSEDNVPYFSTIMRAITKYIPDIRPKGSPNVHSLGKISSLQGLLTDAGFSDVMVKELQFLYEPGRFEDYWSDYLTTTANLIRPVIESKGQDILYRIKSEAQLLSARYTDNDGLIHFPWQVLLSTGINR